MKEEMDKIRSKLQVLCENSGLTNYAFTCTDKDGHYIGFTKEKLKTTEFFETTMNVARMWQFCREQVREALNNFDK